ncbi:MAG: hypothetical protein ACYDAO_03700 [Thermoplasmataceae archaeon]
MVYYNKITDEQGLAYASQRFIDRIEEIFKASPSGLYFSKGLYFINSETKKSHHEIMLPHCWYRWGDEVVRYQMPKELAWTHEEASHTTVQWNGKKVTLQNTDLKIEINKLIDDFIDNYPLKDKGIIELLLSDHYENAPFDFQRNYKTVRDTLFDRSKSSSKSNQFWEDILLPLFQKTFDSFPRDALFKPVADFVPAFMELIKYPSSGQTSELNIVNEISEEFWYWFCYFLRIHPSAHENVNKNTVSYWRSQIDNETQRFIRNFEDHVLSLSKEYEDISRNAVLSPYLERVRDKAATLERTLEDFDETMQGLDEFLANKMSLE